MVLRPGRGTLGFCLAASITATTAVVATTFAQSSRVPVTLEWRGGSCATSREVLAQVALMLGGEAVSSKPVDARASSEALPRGRMRVTIVTRIDGREGERTLDVASCAEAVQATALVVALAVDPARVAAHQAQVASTEAGVVTPIPLVDAATVLPPASAPAIVDAAPASDASAPLPATGGAESSIVDATAPTPAPAGTAPVEPARVETDGGAPHEGSFVWLAAASAFGDVGTLPRLGGGVALALGVQSGALRGEVAFHALLPQSNGEASRGGTFGVLGGNARGCWFLLREGVDLGPCIAAAGERISASGRNVAAPLDEGAGMFALGAGPLFAVPLSSAVRFRLGVDALVPLVRPSFVVQLPTTTAEVHRVGPVLVRGTAGLELLL